MKDELLELRDWVMRHDDDAIMWNQITGKIERMIAARDANSSDVSNHTAVEFPQTNARIRAAAQRLLDLPYTVASYCRRDDLGNHHFVSTEDVNAVASFTLETLRTDDRLKKFRGPPRGEAVRASGAYRSWCSMKNRCYDRNARSYPRYGGSGITVCDEWLIFDNFVRDMGERPQGKTLDRKDPNGHYEPDNCRWATDTEQQNNKKNNIHITAFGKTQSLAEWSEETGIAKMTIYYRIRRGWDLERTLSVPSLRTRIVPGD